MGKSSCKCNCSWYHNDDFVSESNTKQIFHDKIALNSYQFGLEIYEPNSKSAGLYKCMIKNDYGQLQVNLNLNIEPDGQVASTIKTSEAPEAAKKTEKKREKRRNLLHHQKLSLLWQAAGISQHGQLLQALQTPINQGKLR